MRYYKLWIDGNDELECGTDSNGAAQPDYNYNLKCNEGNIFC